MKRASSSLLFHFKHNPNLTKLTPQHFLRTFISHTPSFNQPHQPKSSFNPIPKSPNTIFHRNITQTAQNTEVKPRQRTYKDKTPPVDPIDAFEAAQSLEDMLENFKGVEAALDGNDPKLGFVCMKISIALGKDDKNVEKVMEFADKSLKIFDGNDMSSTLYVAMALHVLGSACFRSRMFNDGLGYLNRANRILSKLEVEGKNGENDGKNVGSVLCAVHLELANTLTAIGRKEEALVSRRKCLEIQEKMLEPGSTEVGVAHRELAEAFVSVLNFKDALPCGLRALEIHLSHLGENSVEVAHDRRLLGVIYTGLEDLENALEQNEKSKKVLKNWGMDSELLHAEIEAANMEIAMGKYESAINTLKKAIMQTDKDSMMRATVFIALADAFSNMENVADAKKSLEMSCSILRKKEADSPEEVADAYINIAGIYENMDELDAAITLLNRTLSVIEKVSQEQHLEGNASAKLGWLLLLTGKVEEAIPYLENAVERLKESFGPNHFGIAYIYNNMGAAYLELDRPQSAAQMFILAKEIMDVSFGEHHADTIDTYQNLSKAYTDLKSYDLAIDYQRKAIQAWESHGPSALGHVKEAKRVLKELKKKVDGQIYENLKDIALDLLSDDDLDKVDHKKDLKNNDSLDQDDDNDDEDSDDDSDDDYDDDKEEENDPTDATTLPGTKEFV